MGDLHTILRSLCFNTHWKYAVFWKLKHRARMVLTWEDVYYENCEDFSEVIGNLNGGGGCYSHDPVGLAVAKMSYHVYSLGEGIVGQVAVTGRSQWIFADKYTTNSFSSFEVSDGWQSQFSSGIKTIVVIAVAPHGVVQLGSLNKVDEDVNLVTHIKEVFLTLQDSSVRHGISPIQYSVKSSVCIPGLPRKDFTSEVIPDSLSDLEKVTNKGRPNDCSSAFPYFQRQSGSSYMSCASSIHQKTSVELTNKDERLELSASRKEGSVKLHQSGSDISYLDHPDQLGMILASNQKNLSRVSDCSVTLGSNNFVKGTVNLCNPQPIEKLGAGFLPLPTDPSSSSVCDSVESDGMDIYLNGTLNASESSGMKLKLKKDLQSDCQLESTRFDASDAFLKFSAGCELFEALGPAFFKRCVSFECGKEKADAGNIAEMPERVSSSQMTFDTGSESLLEAVIGNVCPSGSDVKSEKSICKSVQSMLTAEKTPQLSGQTNHLVNSASFSTNQNAFLEEDTPNCLNSSGVCGAMSSKGFSSTCPNACSQHLDTHSEPAKNNKKRARPGESSRPRPRDRQLIQDRIKELRDLVPNGSKCSIDSLLERTIKHMLFLESVTKHADKLNKCAESKIHRKGADTSNYEQGSSWAVEVGGDLKVSSIIVENINKNGQMLVEMLCEECSHFLEIAEAIRGLGLMILKGVTEEHGEKIWICFVVEGQNNRVMHRMDVLWSLVQMLQPKTTNTN